MKSINSFLLLLIINSTALFAQTSDTISKPGTFTREERERIAERVVRANECDILLPLCETELALADSTVAAKDSVNTKLTDINIAQKGIITGQKVEITGLRTDIDKILGNNKWLKIGWGSSTIAFIISLIYVATH